MFKVELSRLLYYFSLQSQIDVRKRAGNFDFSTGDIRL